MTAKNLLFIDDEESIRLTLPPLLKKHGFEVNAVATVADALAEINDRRYDVLISDLNIDKPGDGFTVISAMRVFQPKCTNIILTGFPGFDTAQQAIRFAVADYFVKPVDIDELVSAITQRLILDEPSSRRRTKFKRKES